jgi:glycosyltransferase involved in cell wall biosynthesis
MKVGIDARFLTHPQWGGFKTYTSSMVDALALTDSRNMYILYTDRPATSICLPSNFEVKPLLCRNSIVREQFVLPFVMRKDVVDVAHFPCNTAPMILSPQMAVTIHDAIPFRKLACGYRLSDWKVRLLTAYWRTAIRRCARIANVVITDSRYSMAQLSKYVELSPNRLEIIPPAVKPIFFKGVSAQPPSELDSQSQFLLTFASSDGRKNHEGSILAYQEVRKHFPTLKLVVVCSHKRVRSVLLEKGVEGVLPIGPVHIEELVWLYANAVALVFPSFDEGFGLPPLEAMASGTPVIASQTGSLPEVLGDCAVLVNPYDPASIAQGVKHVLTDADLREELVEKGKERASNFTYEQLGYKLVSAYRRAALNTNDQGF